MSRAVALLAAALAGLVLAGCGGDEEEAAPDSEFPPTETTAFPGETATSIFEPDVEIPIELLEVDGSRVSGAAVLTPEEDVARTKVIVNVEGGSDVPHPAHIHAGTCEDLGEVVYPLESVERGESTTTVEAPLESLVGGAFAINVHESEQDIQTFIACGDLHNPAVTDE